VFARSRSVDEASNVADASASLRATGAVLLLFGLIVLPTVPPMASALQAYQASVALVILATLSLLGSKRYRHPDIAVFILFSSLASLYLLNASDVLTIFFVLELLNSLVLYSFFFTASYSGAGHSNAAARISSSCVYQLTLNFFSSIVLYAGLVSYISITGGSSLGQAHLWSAHPYATYSVSLFVAAFLLKFGTGPWVLFKINIYRNMNFQLVLLYSVAYLLIIFVLFLNLLFVFGASLSPLASTLIAGVVIAASALFGSFAFQNPNTFVFISFSSLINMGVFVLQAVTAA
jgi:NADH:ubiquinone oxidoreductase subunit 2 (subunit N)